jgi:hypothetical protein
MFRSYGHNRGWERSLKHGAKRVKFLNTSIIVVTILMLSFSHDAAVKQMGLINTGIKTFNIETPYKIILTLYNH